MTAIIGIGVANSPRGMMRVVPLTEQTSNFPAARLMQRRHLRFDMGQPAVQPLMGRGAMLASFIRN
jgi:hypothetical protein